MTHAFGHEPDARLDLSPLAFARRYPVTLTLTLILYAVAFTTAGNSPAQMRPLEQRYGLDYQALKELRLWPMPVSTVLQSDPGIDWFMVVFVMTSLFAVETLAGSIPALITFVASDWISSPLTELVLRGLAALDVAEAKSLLLVAATGSSAAFHGCYAAAAMLMPRKWRTASLALLLGVVAFQFAFERLDDAIAHTLATVIGAALGHYVWRRRSATISGVRS